MILCETNALILSFDEEEIKKLPEFEGRNIAELKPAIFAFRSDLEKNCIQIISQLRTPVGIISSGVISFDGISTEDELICTVDKFFVSGIFRWELLLNRYDEKIKKEKEKNHDH